MTTVWISPSATSFSCLCETCLEQARTGGMLFAEALMLASVRDEIDADVAVASRRCAAGHEVVLRRGERPPLLSHRQGQLQIA
ncbi:MAG TPA: hypothetical protein VHC01_07250 [Gaiellaceae bacterium]|nr:hypothetical protein [Gaiellaceae bacterium]